MVGGGVTLAQGRLGPRVRWAFSDRLAVDGVPSSAPPYDAFNLADHVGDDPERVRAHRDALAAAVGVDGHRLVSMAPVHGNDVGEVGRAAARARPRGRRPRDARPGSPC